MPLVVPGISNTTGDKTEEWTNKLVGKTLSDDTSSTTVRYTHIYPYCFCLCLPPRERTSGLTRFAQSFCKADLPQETRIVEPGMMVTKDFKPERLNVHLKEDGTVSHVVHG